MSPAGQILSTAQMRGAEDALIAAGVSVEALMQRAGQGAADWVWRMAGAQRRVTVLCGPGNNGGDGWIIAETLRQRGGQVAVVEAAAPRSAAAQVAKAGFRGAVVEAASGDVLVDCLYGTGLTRGLGESDLALLHGLAARHAYRIALDVPSGISSDTGAAWNDGLPDYHLTIALGAWKPAHGLMPACAAMGAMRLVEIGCAAVEGAGRWIARPEFSAPAPDAHKYRRGMLGVVAGAMSGAAILAATSAQGAGAGYVKLFAHTPVHTPPDLVCAAPDYSDPRLSALLVGPGLGRDAQGFFALAQAVEAGKPLVLDADALHLLTKGMRATIATPHEGELAAMEQIFGSGGEDKITRARALAQASGMVIVAKGPDTVVAAPDGRWALAPRASSWLSTAGTGDVLAGAIASRLASGATPFDAACQGVWLHGEAARITPAPFSAGELVKSIPSAYRACL
ncbi:NAD(P)H-hydrate dehydratase [Novosphingobium umbonatum]|uniref:Bifunctional NAD(P)H-hydrate repair enzyme n=1 Tax=Novosphingobium umbonatum TaxID=1908524 RepID=A0A3S2Y657_9SPHN|nr:NAD(P)H-hydrate dehydratase [Novosphingobium umbonatum]RVU04437.1 NAD(P)H-hydrate dehydratase [Novosphingobium umbonatum]